MKRVYWLSAVYMFLKSSLAGAAVFAASPDYSEWISNTSRLTCSLSHAIPMFGQALLIQNAGEPPVLQVEAIKVRAASEGDVAQLYTLPASWSRPTGRDQLAEVPVQAGFVVVEIKGALINHALAALQAGRQVGIALPKEDPGEADPATLRLSSVGFLSAYRGYELCLQQLVPLSFGDLAKSELYFESNTMRLTSSAQNLLEYVMVYDDKAGPLRKILLEGHTDNVGRFVNNTKLSLQRALAVKDWLVFAGIPPDIIEVKALGGSRPMASNKTATGRAQNRRVTMSVSR